MLVSVLAQRLAAAVVEHLMEHFVCFEGAQVLEDLAVAIHNVEAVSLASFPCSVHKDPFVAVDLDRVGESDAACYVGARVARPLDESGIFADVGAWATDVQGDAAVVEGAHALDVRASADVRTSDVDDDAGAVAKYHPFRQDPNDAYDAGPVEMVAGAAALCSDRDDILGLIFRLAGQRHYYRCLAAI